MDEIFERKNMIYTFTGAQSTGKTTLLNLCKKRHKNFQYVDEITRKIKREGNKINDQEDNYDETQLLICEDHLRNLRLNGKYLIDRCIVDGYVYTRYLFDEGKVSIQTYRLAKCLLDCYRDKYTKIFYTDPKDVKLVSDGVRSVDKKFRNNIIKIYKEINIEGFSNVVKLSGTIEERYKQIKPFLEL